MASRTRRPGPEPVRPPSSPDLFAHPVGDDQRVADRVETLLRAPKRRGLTPDQGSRAAAS
jgi:hypothetical protein